MVEKPDVIGAIFGQTEGLLGQDLDLRELQKTGRIGRIDVEIENSNGQTVGHISIPSSLDSSETSLLAASLETIERIGPSTAKVNVKDVKDIRAIKRDFMLDRAKTILGRLVQEELPTASSLTEQIEETVRSSQIQEYQNLPAGPDIENEDELIMVEGRADVVNLLKNGIKNVIAIGGSIIPQIVIELSKKKRVTLFVDGDRAGDLIAKEFVSLGDLDYLARAPEGKEVEELSKKEIFKCLRERLSLEQNKIEIRPKELNEFIKKEDSQSNEAS